MHAKCVGTPTMSMQFKLIYLIPFSPRLHNKKLYTMLQNNNYNEYLRDFYECLPRKWSCKDLLIVTPQVFNFLVGDQVTF